MNCKQGYALFTVVKEYLEEKVREGCFPGCCIGVVFKKKHWYGFCGRINNSENSPRVKQNTIYDVASITKVIPVSCTALKMIENGILTPEDHVYKIIPEYGGNYREQVQVKHLLSHTISFGFRLSTLRHLDADAILQAILNASLTAPPGKTYSYANATSILLGMVIERKAGKTLDCIAEEMFFKPLGMRKTSFHPELFSAADIAPTEYDPERAGIVHGVVHDESANRLYPKVVGSAGLFSTVSDVSRFIEMLLNEGCRDVRFFNKETIRLMYSNALPSSMGCKTGWGWELDQTFMGKLRSTTTFGKTGFTGCSIVIDPSREVGMVLLSNHIFPKRRNNRLQITTVRAEVADIVFKAVDNNG